MSNSTNRDNVRLGPPARRRARLGSPLLALALALFAAGTPQQATAAPATRLATLVVRTTPQYDEALADAVVESTTQSVIASQVPGRVVALRVKAGDRVAAGQLLLSIDSRTADQQAAAMQAQATAARAERDVAARELDRTRTLFAKQYVSQAALDRAVARYRAAAAMAAARDAELKATAVGVSLHRIVAPYAATIARVDAEVGTMATPGTPLLTLYDPASLRAAATLPQADVARMADRSAAPPRIELPDLPAPQRWQRAASVTVLPVADPLSHSVTIRLGLPPGATAARPGMFARAYFPLGEAHPRLMIPASSVVHRTEVTAVYVVTSDGRAQLRQVRLGPVRGNDVEVLSGLAPGERIALDPLAATRQSAALSSTPR